MNDRNAMDRRRFLKTTAAGLGTAAVGASALQAADKPDEGLLVPEPKVDPKDLIWRSKEPTMEYRRLGRTNYMVSRIVAGIGGEDAIWRRMLGRGLNYFDTAWGYKGGNHELDLSEFCCGDRDCLLIRGQGKGPGPHSSLQELYTDDPRRWAAG